MPLTFKFISNNYGKNYIMKKIDKVTINIIAFLAILLISLSLIKNFAASVLIAFLLTVTLYKLFVHFYSRMEKINKISVSKMEELFAIMGSEQVNYFINVTPPCFCPQKADSGYIITLNCEKTMIFPQYKFSPCSNEDIAKFYREAKKYDVENIKILSKLNARQTIMFARELDVNFEFVPSKNVRRYLYNHNALPELIKKEPEKRKSAIEFFKKAPAEWKEFFSSIFIKKRAKYFFLSSISMAILSLFTPLKWYYILMSIVTLACGITCVLRENA